MQRTQIKPTWFVTVGSSRPPGGQRCVWKHLLAAQLLRDLPGGDGVLEVLPPGQGGTQQAQGFTGPGRTLQNPVEFLEQAGILVRASLVILLLSGSDMS